MTETPDPTDPTNPEQPPRPVEEAQAEPYDATASNEPTVDAQPPEEEPEVVVPGEHPWGMACHLAIFANAFCLVGLVLPLIIREKARKQDPEVEYHAKEALNFQLNVIPIALVLIFLMAVSKVCVLFAPAWLVLPLLVIATTGYAVIAALKASEGKRYRYPYIKRFIN